MFDIQIWGELQSFAVLLSSMWMMMSLQQGSPYSNFQVERNLQKARGELFTAYDFWVGFQEPSDEVNLSVFDFQLDRNLQKASV